MNVVLDCRTAFGRSQCQRDSAHGVCRVNTLDGSPAARDSEDMQGVEIHERASTVPEDLGDFRD